MTDGPFRHDGEFVPMGTHDPAVLTEVLSVKVEAEGTTVKVIDFWGATAVGVLSAVGDHVVLRRVLEQLK